MKKNIFSKIDELEEMKAKLESQTAELERALKIFEILRNGLHEFNKIEV